MKKSDKESQELQAEGSTMKSSKEQRQEFVSELVHYDSLRLQAKVDAEEKALQAEADAKATPNETWQALYEEGEEKGDRDAAEGISKHYDSAVEALKHHPQQPYWEGYVKGYEDHIGRAEDVPYDKNSEEAI